MASILYPTGLDAAFLGWTTDTFEWFLLLDSSVPSGMEIFMDEISADEPTDGSYGRVAVASPARIITPPVTSGGIGYVAFDADDPLFATLAGAESIAWLGIVNVVTVDADSPIVALLPAVLVTDGSNYEPELPAAGAFRIATRC